MARFDFGIKRNPFARHAVLPDLMIAFARSQPFVTGSLEYLAQGWRKIIHEQIARINMSCRRAYAFMHMSDDIYLDRIRNVICLFQQVRYDIADTLAQAFKTVTFSDKARNIAFLYVPDFGFIIPSGTNYSMAAHWRPSYGSRTDHDA